MAVPLSGCSTTRTPEHGFDTDSSYTFSGPPTTIDSAIPTPISQFRIAKSHLVDDDNPRTSMPAALSQ